MSKKEQILSTTKKILHSKPNEVDGITTKDWIGILKQEGVITTPQTFIKHFKNFLEEEYRNSEQLGYYVLEYDAHYVWGDSGHQSVGDTDTSAPMKYYWFFT